MKNTLHVLYLVILAFFIGTVNGEERVEQDANKLIRQTATGKLEYFQDAQGNRLPDFSYVGYHSGEKPIPHVPVSIVLEPADGDATERIQNAFDKLGTMPVGSDGFRGALLLKKGVYRISGRLNISQSGIVLRGEGPDPAGTILIATGFGDEKFIRSLITVSFSSDHSDPALVAADKKSVPVNVQLNTKRDIIDDMVPIGAQSFTLTSTSGYQVGDNIAVYRPSTKEWIHEIGCDQLEPRWGALLSKRWVKDGAKPGFYYERDRKFAEDYIPKYQDETWDAFVKRIPLSSDGKQLNFTKQWRAGDFDFYFERKIIAIQGNRITIDAPIVQALEKRFGGGSIYRHDILERVTDVGIENLRLVSEFGTPSPEHPYGQPSELNQSEFHAWNGIELEANTENIWVRNVSGQFFGWSLVTASGSHATIQDCAMLGHASRITGGRRYSFMIDGQLNLVQRCLTIEGRHEFVMQRQAAGPNVFVDCIGLRSHQASGPHHRYAVGSLYDNVKSEFHMESTFRGASGSGHGWAGAQTCFYNCIAPEFKVKAPPGGVSWLIGASTHYDAQTRAAPASLYYQQVHDRLGKDGLDNLLTAEQLQQIGTFSWVKERLKLESTPNKN